LREKRTQLLGLWHTCIKKGTDTKKLVVRHYFSYIIVYWTRMIKFNTRHTFITHGIGLRNRGAANAKNYSFQKWNHRSQRPKKNSCWRSCKPYEMNDFISSSCTVSVYIFYKKHKMLQLFVLLKNMSLLTRIIQQCTI
jgi:hypothetical protein